MKIMMKFILAFLVLGATPALAEQVLYCQDELATGMIHKNGKWETGKFKPQRHTIKVFGDFLGIELSGSHFKNQYFECSTPNSKKLTQSRICIAKNKFDNSIGSYFFFIDMKSLRYSSVFVSSGGYIESFIAPGNNPDTDSLHAGTCTKF